MKKSLGIVLSGYATFATMSYNNVGYNILNKAPQVDASVAAVESVASRYSGMNRFPHLGFWKHPEAGTLKIMSPEDWDSASFGKRYDETSRLIRKYVDHYGLESYGHGKDVLESALKGILYTESRFDRKAVSSSDAWGLFQISPYARSVYSNGLGDFQIDNEQDKYFDPHTNIQAGVSWFGNVCLKEAGGNLEKAMRMFHRGNNFNCPEARNYQRKVMKTAALFRSGTVLEKMPEAKN